MASQGHGATSHLTAAIFQRKTGARLIHVPFSGTAPALNALASGTVDMMFADIASVLPLHNGGNVRILAATTAERLPELRAIPTLQEAGVPDFESTTWFAMAAPPGTPPAIIAKLSAGIGEILRMPEIDAKLRGLTATPVGSSSPSETRAHIEAETRR